MRISFAQDYHFSQFYNNPIADNPSLTAAFDGVFRASVIGRTQWLSVTTPFMTIGTEIDGAVYKNSRRQELFALGISLNGDKSGDLSYQSAQASLTMSYIKNIGRYSRHKIGVGLCGGIINNSLDLSKGTWDNQFIGGIFDPNISSGEVLLSTSKIFADFGIGAFWSFLPTKDMILRVSASALHINRPFYGVIGKEVRLPIRYSLQLYSQIGITSAISIYPMLYTSFQNNYTESLLGCNVEYFKKKNNYTTLYTFGGGLFYRWRDALVINTFVSCKNLKLSVSYDVNISPFVVATHGRGAFEIALSYIFKRKTITRIGKEPCPYDIM